MPPAVQRGADQAEVGIGLAARDVAVVEDVDPARFGAKPFGIWREYIDPGVEVIAA